MQKKIKNAKFSQKQFLPQRNLSIFLDKMSDISKNYFSIQTNEVLNESLWYQNPISYKKKLAKDIICAMKLVNIFGATSLRGST